MSDFAFNTQLLYTFAISDVQLRAHAMAQYLLHIYFALVFWAPLVFKPWLITFFCCFNACCTVAQNTEYHIASSRGLIQGSKGKSVYSPVMSAHDITWVHSSAGSLGRYLREITQAKGGLVSSPCSRTTCRERFLFIVKQPSRALIWVTSCIF